MSGDEWRPPSTEPERMSYPGMGSFRYAPGMRCASTAGCLPDPLCDLGYTWWQPRSDRCAWSPEIARERARVMEIDNQIFAAVEAARARQLAEARYSEQRRQALAAILYGVVIMVLVIAAAGR